MISRAERLGAMHDRLCFARAFPRSATDLRRAARGLARFERLARPVKDELEDTGIARDSIDVVPGCTFTDREHFFSFRRDGKQSGRHLAAIVPRDR